MRVWVALALIVATLSGCAGDEEPVVEAFQEAKGDAVDDGTTPLPTFLVNVALPEGNLTAGLFNFTLEGPENATWSANLVGADGFPANGTNGVGLPANVSFELLEGNYTLYVAATLDGHEPFEYNQTLAVLPGVPAVADPCVNAVVQDVFTASISMQGGAAQGTSTYQDIFFEVLPCQEAMSLTWEYPQSAYDLDITLFDPSGKEVAGRGSFDYPEPGIDVKGGLAPGEWQLEVYEYATLPQGSFDLTVTFS